MRSRGRAKWEVAWWFKFAPAVCNRVLAAACFEFCFASWLCICCCSAGKSNVTYLMYCKCCLVVCLSAFAAKVYVAVLCRITSDLRFKGLRLWLGVAWLGCRLECVFRWFGGRFCESVSFLILSLNARNQQSSCIQSQNRKANLNRHCEAVKEDNFWSKNGQFKYIVCTICRA